MTPRTTPSTAEPESLADLIADCAALPAAIRPRPRVLDLTRLPLPRPEVTIPAATSSLAEPYADLFV